MRKVILYALVFVAMWSISQLLIVIFSCTPIEKFWLGESIPNGKCMPNLPFWYVNAGGNILTDVLIFVIPLPALGSLKLRKNQKLALIGIFCLGFFVSIPLFNNLLSSELASQTLTHCFHLFRLAPSPLSAFNISSSPKTLHGTTSTLPAGPFPNSPPALSAPACPRSALYSRTSSLPWAPAAPRATPSTFTTRPVATPPRAALFPNPASLAVVALYTRKMSSFKPKPAARRNWRSTRP